MSLSVGIIGLPNAGKSTLFNALASRRLAESAPRPFTTIDPNEAVVSVPDNYLRRLVNLIKPEKTVPATVTFIDIAGLVKGASEGEGLGNQFLAKIREVDAIIHVVRAFNDPNIAHSHPQFEVGSMEQITEDIGIVNLELELAEIEKKPTIYVLNVSDAELTGIKGTTYVNEIKKKFAAEAIAISAKFEEELIDIEPDQRTDFIKGMGIFRSGLELLIQKAYLMLDLISFYTIKPSSAKASEGRGGGTIVTAWSIKRGSDAIAVAEVVHTDFAKKFIKAEVVGIDELLEVGSWKLAKEKGKIRLEGKDYIVQERDVIEFKIGA